MSTGGWGSDAGMYIWVWFNIYHYHYYNNEHWY